MGIDGNSHQKNGSVVLARRLWLAALFLGLGYFLTALARSGVVFEELSAIPKAIIVGWKGTYTLILAAAVFVSHSNKTTLLLAGVFVLIAIADMLLVTVGLTAGGVVFAIAHIVAIFAYKRNRSPNIGPARGIAVWAFPVFAVGLSCFALFYGDNKWALGLFVAFSSCMAVAALQSRFPWWLTGIGSVFFVFSDVIFFVGTGFFGSAAQLGWAVWLCFSVGLALMARGAMRFDERRHSEA